MSLLMDIQTNRCWARVDFLATGEIALHIPEECELPIRVLVSRGGRSTEYEPNSSEKPNNCEPQTIRCPKCGRTDYIRDMEKDMGIKGSHYKYKCINCNTYIKDEPTISKMEQVDEPQTETSTNSEKVQLKVQLKDEPQTDCAWK